MMQRREGWERIDGFILRRDGAGPVYPVHVTPVAVAQTLQLLRVAFLTVPWPSEN